ncbi:MAG: T9SS type A sorting domain-containing protein [Chitinophagales bacterium]|nr:T9SS type A sorting domain-containing protein [Chitinophagales bacterium]
MKIFYSVLLLIIVSLQLNAQIIRVEPIFPKQDGVVKIIFDAKEVASGAMLGVNKVYMHSSIGTNPDQYVWTGSYTIGNWGQDDGVGEMTSIGNDEWEITMVPDAYYNIPGNVTAYNLAMVFRNEDGSAEGKNPDGSDIFHPLYSSGLAARFVNPSSTAASFYFSDLNDVAEVYAAASDSSTMSLYVNGGLVKQVFDDSLSYTYLLTQPGINELLITAVSASDTAVDSTFIVTKNPLVIQDPPSGTEPGINIRNDSTVVFGLVAPNKSSVYVIGSFANYLPIAEAQMNQSLNGDFWWVEISSLDDSTEYIYQYMVDGSLMIADPYSEKILDEFNDPFIPTWTYPDLIEFPSNKLSGRASAFKINETEYIWQNTSFTKPDKQNLIIYELLIRDFLAAHDYQTLIDTLDYLEHLGVNAIELMPVNEFEGNESWGYNPSFYFAPDKYYGTKNDLKQFIDECHGRGIAVIVDVVLNHSFGQSPMVQMYFDGSGPSADNPWYNQIAKHDFNVGYDFNHESQYTIDFVDDVVKFWINEYKVDGYRFDLSKGFTQNNTLGNVGAWGAFDQSRVDLWKRMADTLWTLDPEFYIILEHFADNSEEMNLANYGMMLWGNANHASAEATMGYVSTSDLTWGFDYDERSWNDPHLVTYSESHDEERLMYKNKTFGNTSGQYSTKDLYTGLARVEALATILMTFPGPKLMWMFGELGYDISIDDPCRVCNKPIKWNYLNIDNRRRLYEVYSSMINLRLDEVAFLNPTSYQYKLTGAIKRVQLFHPDMDVVSTANFDVVSKSSNVVFPHTGKWYEYFSGDSITVNSTAQQIDYLPGQYYLYTTKRLQTPSIPVGIYEDLHSATPGKISVFPNPNRGTFYVNVYSDAAGEVKIELFDIVGNKIDSKLETVNSGWKQIEYRSKLNLAQGSYILKVESGEGFHSQKIIIQK